MSAAQVAETVRSASCGIHIVGRDCGGDTAYLGCLRGIGGADNSAKAAGAAYVFVRSGSTWSQQAYLKASNTNEYNFFGSSVAVSGDTVVVGAINVDTAYVFVRSGISWTQQAELKASNPDASDSFGFSVAVAGDTVVVGAPGESSSATGVDGNQANQDATSSGAVYAFAPSVAPTITSPAPDAGMVGRYYYFLVTASGTPDTFTFSASGLPPGLTIGPSTGRIDGEPTQAGSFPVTITVSNGALPVATQTVTLVIASPQPPTITSAARPPARLARPTASQSPLAARSRSPSTPAACRLASIST